MSKKEEITFEQSLARMEEIVEALDGGELPLSESLLLFEEGIKLARRCSKELSEARGRLEMLVKNPDGTVSKEDLQV